MESLDVDGLGDLIGSLRRRVASKERQMRNLRLRSALNDSMIASMRKARELTMGPTLDSLESLLRLEQLNAEYDTKAAEEDAKRDAVLTAVHKRTAFLKSWLEALS